MSYEYPRYGAKHITAVGLLTNAAAAATIGRFASYMNAKLLDIFAVIHNGAGTAATSGWTIKKATTSIGAIAASTSTEGEIIAASLTDTDIIATDVINIENTRSDTNLQGFVYVVWQENFAR